jgi:hypothetical protein
VQSMGSSFIPQVTGVQSPALTLAHEAVHAVDSSFLFNNNTYNAQYNNDAEALAVGIEAKIAGDLGEPQRLNHDGLGVPGVATTEHTVTNGDGSTGWTYTDGSGSAVPLSDTFSALGIIPIVPNSIPGSSTQSFTDQWNALGPLAQPDASASVFNSAQAYVNGGA